jgi:hypothetical protein
MRIRFFLELIENKVLACRGIRGRALTSAGAHGLADQEFVYEFLLLSKLNLLSNCIKD